MLSPVIVFAYNRLEMLQSTLRALEENTLAKETELFLFADGAKDRQEAAAVGAVADFLRQYAVGAPFKRVTLEIHEEHRGLAKSVIAGVSRVIEQYGRVIVVEDDLVSSPDFLRYMNGALDYYEKNSQIWSVSGYSPHLKALEKYPADVYFYYRASSWGWGTWADRWKTVDWEVSDYPALKDDKEKIKAFNRGGDDMFEMLSRQKAGEIDSWAIRWCYAQFKKGQYCVYPRESRIKNMGCRSGTHFHDEWEDRYDTEIVREPKECRFEEPALNRRVVKNFQKLYSKSLYAKICRHGRKACRKLMKRLHLAGG